MTNKRYFRVRDLTERYGVSRSTIWNWRRTRLLPEPLRIGLNTIVWPPEAIEEFEARRVQTGGGREAAHEPR